VCRSRHWAVKNTAWNRQKWHSIDTSLKHIQNHNFSTSWTRPATSLGHQRAVKSFLIGPKLFKRCSIVLNYVQHIFPVGQKFLQGDSPPWLRACLEHRGNMTEYSFYNCIRYQNAKVRQSRCSNYQVVCKDANCVANHRRSQGGPGCHAPAKFLAYTVNFVLWKAAFQTKYCYSPKIKHFGPPKMLGWLRQCRNKI